MKINISGNEFVLEWYYIVGGIAIIFTIYFFFLFLYSKKRKAKQLQEFMNRYSGGPLTEEQKRFLSFAGPLSLYRNEEILGMIPKDDLKMHVYGLNNQWGINNPQEAKETIEDLINFYRSSEFDQILNVGDAEIENIKGRIAKKLKIDISEVQSVKSTYAWDMVRAASLAKWCFWVGYLTEAEAWDFMNRVVKNSSEKGENWKEYLISFLLGRTIHGFDLDDVYNEVRWLYEGSNPGTKIEDIDVYEKISFR